MAAHLLEPTDSIEIKCLPCLIYGPPGSGKTSLGQTADNPLTLDFDKGIHRSFNRKRAFRFDSWADCIEEQRVGGFNGYGALVIDTLGALLDAIAKHVMAESSKNAMGGGLSIQGWGVLGNRFGQWVRGVVSGGQDVVMVCHEQEDKGVDEKRYVRPTMPGNMAYNTVHRLVDLMGHVQYDGRNRFLQFSPTETSIGKNAAGFDLLPIPRLEDNPSWLADVLAQAKRKIGQTAEASALVAKVVGEWQARLDADPTVDELNSWLPDIGMLTGAAKKQAWHLCKEFAAKAGLSFDPNFKRFVKAVAA